MMRFLAWLLIVGAGAAKAQETIVIPPSRTTILGAGQGEGGALPQGVSQGAATTAEGGTVRVLDKINGTLTDLALRSGETGEVGTLTVTMGECRYPSDNPSGDAFALVSIRTLQDETALFEGWLVASAPALNAMDHPRYDVWALRCMGV